jgi:small GTP-binding protein
MIVNGKVAKVQVWDTAGQERYRAITKAYYRGAEAIIIVFSLDDEVSFRNIRQWMEDVVKYTGNDVLVAVAANKADLDERKVNEKDINELKQTQKVCVYEMSAKTGKGVEEAFEKVVEELIRRKRNEQGNDARRGERELLIGGGGDSKYNNVNRACCW